MSTTKRDGQGRILPRPQDDPEAKVHLHPVGWFAEYEETEARENYAREIWSEQLVRKNWENREVGRLCTEMYQKFQAYKAFVEKWHPYDAGRGDGQPVDFPEHLLFSDALVEYEQKRQALAESARQSLEKARQAARCEHIHTDGRQCGSPRMKDHTLCYMHNRMAEAKAAKLDLGPMEDADSIQLGIKKLQAAVIDGTLDASQVRQLAYLIQLAAWNVRGTLFGSREQGEQGVR